jgi:hypothetical protein
LALSRETNGGARRDKGEMETDALVEEVTADGGRATVEREVAVEPTVDADGGLVGDWASGMEGDGAVAIF